MDQSLIHFINLLKLEIKLVHLNLERQSMSNYLFTSVPLAIFESGTSAE